MPVQHAAVQSDDIVRLIDIRKTYITGDLQVPVLKGIDANVKRGEFVGFIGTSGSGKSTLLNILGMLDVPTGGEYYLEDTEVGQLTDVEQATIRNRKIGFIFQSFNLFPHLSVEMNIEVPMIYGRVPGRKRRKRALELAQQVGLGHRLGHRPTQLSGGECQRIAIARALSNQPAFILADEPTGNLDEKTSSEIMKLFHHLNREEGVTIVMVTHNPALAPHYDKIIRLRDGRIDDTKFDWEVPPGQEHVAENPGEVIHCTVPAAEADAEPDKGGALLDDEVTASSEPATTPGANVAAPTETATGSAAATASADATAPIVAATDPAETDSESAADQSGEVTP